MDLAVFFEHPEAIGREVGFKDLTPLHGLWIRNMVFGSGDYTLQAHRGSYKSSCLAVAISILLVYWPDRNIIFLRKTDSDVSEMLGMVSKILHSVFFQDLVREMHQGAELTVEGESMNHLSTNLWTSPMGAPQLLGLGIRASITGKHAWYVITDDICNAPNGSERSASTTSCRTSATRAGGSSTWELPGTRTTSSARCRTSTAMTAARPGSSPASSSNSSGSRWPPPFSPPIMS